MKIILSLSLIILLGSCAGGWTDTDKKQFRDQCLQQARSQISEENSTKYCDCFVEQMVKTYPVFNDVTERYNADTIERLKAHCRQEIGVQ